MRRKKDFISGDNFAGNTSGIDHDEIRDDENRHLSSECLTQQHNVDFGAFLTGSIPTVTLYPYELIELCAHMSDEMCQTENRFRKKQANVKREPPCLDAHHIPD